MKEYDISVLLLESDQEKVAKIIEILDTIGVKGNLIHLASGESRLRNFKEYDIIIKGSQGRVKLNFGEVNVNMPLLIEEDYANLEIELIRALDEKFAYH